MGLGGLFYSYGETITTHRNIKEDFITFSTPTHRFSGSSALGGIGKFIGMIYKVQTES